MSKGVCKIGMCMAAIFMSIGLHIPVDLGEKIRNNILVSNLGIDDVICINTTKRGIRV